MTFPFEDWRRGANWLFGPNRMGHAYAVLAGFSGPLVNHSPGPISVLALTGRGSDGLLRLAMRPWPAVVDIDVGHEFGADDPPLMTCLEMGTRAIAAQVELVRNATDFGRSLLIVAHKNTLRTDFRRGPGPEAIVAGQQEADRRMVECRVTAIPSQEQHRFRGFYRDSQRVAAHYLEYVASPDIQAWLSDFIPAAAREYFEDIAHSEPRRELRANLFAVMTAAGHLLTRLKLVNFSVEHISANMAMRLEPKFRLRRSLGNGRFIGGYEAGGGSGALVAGNGMTDSDGLEPEASSSTIMPT